MRRRLLPTTCAALVLCIWIACTSFSAPPHDIAYVQLPVDPLDAPAVGLPASGSTPRAPLGPADRIFVRDGHFHALGSDLLADTDDDRRVRFFGVNLALSANFPSSDAAERLAQRLETLGVNLVRLHAIDQPARQGDRYPVGILADAQHPDLDPQAAQALKTLIVTLSRHGIYVDLNLHANHTFPKLQADDEIPPQSKPLQIFDEDMIRWQERYLANLAQALDAAQMPGIAMIEISNESTLIDTWQEDRLPTLVKGRFRDQLERRWEAYRDTHGLGDEPLPMLRSGQSPAIARAAAEFFVALDRDYITRMVAAVRTNVGERMPVSGTQVIHSGRWKHGGFANLDVNASASFLDAHFYVDHYWFPQRQWDWTNWRISNSWLGDAFEDTLLNVAYARQQGKPFVISEFNQPWPNEQGSDLLPVVTQFALGQDWDGLILYTYAYDQDLDQATPSSFSLKGDWTKLLQFSQCARYFLEGHAGLALPETVVSMRFDDRIDAALANVSGKLSAYLHQSMDLATDTAAGRRLEIADAAQAGVFDKQGETSTSYLVHDPAGKRILFGSAYAAGISGELPQGQSAASGMLELSLLAPSRGFVTAFLNSLDGRPLADSGHLLLTLPGSTMGMSGQHRQRLERVDLINDWWTIQSPDGATDSSSLKVVDGPIWMERIAATVTLAMRQPNPSIYALDVSGHRVARLDQVSDGAHVTFSVNGSGQPFAASFEIVAP